jgi:hypothetical protein
MRSMQRIEVTDKGITVTLVTEPLVSMYGKEMRPGSTHVYALPWDEISEVALFATELEHNGERWVSLDVGLTWGEYFEIHEDAEGFGETVRELCQSSGIAVPDMASITTAGQVIWPGPGPA